MESTIEDQFTALYRRHRVAVERYVLRRTQPEEAGDVLAEVFLTAWRRFEEIPAESLPWLYGVARRVLANDRRATQRRTNLEDLLASQPRQPDAGHAEGVVARTDLARAFDRLSAADQEVLRLALWEELTPAEMAQVLEQSSVAVRVRVHRARQRLRKQLQAAPAVHTLTSAPTRQEADHARH